MKRNFRLVIFGAALWLFCGMGRPGGPPPDTGGYNYKTESGLAGYLKVAGINSDQISSILAMLGMNSESYSSGSLFSLNS